MQRFLIFVFIFHFLFVPLAFSAAERVEIDLDILHSKNVEEDYPTQLAKVTNSVALIKSKYIKDVSVKDLIHSSLHGMMEELDPYSEFLDEGQYEKLLTETSGSYAGLGLVVGRRGEHLVVISPIEGTPAHKAGIRPGDRILEVGELRVVDLPMTEALHLLRGKPGTKVALTIERPEEDIKITLVIKREVIELVSVQETIFLREGIAYIRVLDFDSNASKALKKELKKIRKQTLKGLILDLRNNPGGLLSSGVEVADLFLKKGEVIVTTKGREGEERLRFQAKKKPILTEDLPVAILINKGSASASEIVAGIFQDYSRGVVIGEPSFGKGSVQMVVPFSDGTAIRLTTDYYYTPKGREIEGKGIEPDELFLSEPISEEDLTKGLSKKERLLRDTQVKKALEIFTY